MNASRLSGNPLVSASARPALAVYTGECTLLASSDLSAAPLPPLAASLPATLTLFGIGFAIMAGYGWITSETPALAHNGEVIDAGDAPRAKGRKTKA